MKSHELRKRRARRTTIVVPRVYVQELEIYIQGKPRCHTRPIHNWDSNAGGWPPRRERSPLRYKRVGARGQVLCEHIAYFQLGLFGLSVQWCEMTDDLPVFAAHATLQPVANSIKGQFGRAPLKRIF